MPPVDGRRYHTSTAVFMSEVFKLAMSLTMALYEIITNPNTPQSSTAAGLFGELGGAVFTGDSWKLAIPAMLYILQNSLHYMAVGNLDAATFQVTSQLKILTTAVSSVCLLRKTLSLRQWSSLVLLVVGVAVVSIPVGFNDESVLTIHDLKDGVAFHSPRKIWDLKKLGNAAAGQLDKRSATYAGIDEDYAAQHSEVQAGAGLVALVITCILSGLSGTYFEKILKEPATDSYSGSVWIRNVQLSFYSLWPALFIGVLFMDGEHIASTGFFAGYNWVVWTAVAFQAAGGIMVALVIKHLNNDVKNLATSFSIVVSFMASIALFEFEITFFYLFGTGIVLSAIYFYSTAESESSRKLKPPPISISDYEKSDEPSYFDLESVVTAGKSPMRGDAISTSRPGTPTTERRSLRTKSPEVSRNKRV